MTRYDIAKIRNILSGSDAENVDHAFVTIRVNYNNSSQSEVKSLQLIQNASARVPMNIKKRNHISSVLPSLHWHPVKSGKELNILLLPLSSQLSTVTTCSFKRECKLMTRFFPSKTYKLIWTEVLLECMYDLTEMKLLSRTVPWDYVLSFYYT